MLGNREHQLNEPGQSEKDSTTRSPSYVDFNEPNPEQREKRRDEQPRQTYRRGGRPGRAAEDGPVLRSVRWRGEGPSRSVVHLKRTSHRELKPYCANVNFLGVFLSVDHSMIKFEITLN